MSLVTVKIYDGSEFIGTTTFEPESESDAAILAEGLAAAHEEWYLSERARVEVAEMQESDPRDEYGWTYLTRYVDSPAF